MTTTRSRDLRVGDILQGPGILDRFADDGPELIGGEGFGNEIEGPLLHGLDRMLDRGVTGDDNDYRIRMMFPDLRQHIETREDRHHQIGKDDVEVPLVYLRQALLAIAGQGHLESHLLEDNPAGVTYPRLIIDDEDARSFRLIRTTMLLISFSD